MTEEQKERFEDLELPEGAEGGVMPTMTFPEENGLDRMLARLGKRRAVLMAEVSNAPISGGYMKGVKEPIIKSLLRKPGTPLPEGWIYLDELRPDEDDRND